MSKAQAQTDIYTVIANPLSTTSALLTWTLNASGNTGVNHYEIRKGGDGSLGSSTFITNVNASTTSGLMVKNSW